MKPVVLLFITAALCNGQDGRPTSRWVDLTYALNNQTVLPPGKKMLLGVEYEGELSSGDWLASRGFCISEHTGTHIDPPYHFYKNGRTLSEIPIESLLDIPGVCIDVYDKVQKFDNGKLNVNSNYAVTRRDLQEWESKNGPIPPGSIALIRTGWGSRWSDAAEYLGVPAEKRNTTEVRSLGDPTQPYKFSIDLKPSNILNYPGLDSTAAMFLSTDRNVTGVGIDTLSVDPGSSNIFVAKKIFAKNNVYILENVANLHSLPPKGFQLFAVPFKVERGTGSPTRILAKLPLH